MRGFVVVSLIEYNRYKVRANIITCVQTFTEILF